jgi:hypothetical protein
MWGWSVRDDTGRVLARSVLETHGASIVEFLRGMRGAIHVAFEVGTQSQWVYEGYSVAVGVRGLVPSAVGADCQGKNRPAISDDEVRP